MFDKITAFSIQNRPFVLLAGLLVTILGVVIGSRQPIDVLPDLNKPTVTIMTEAHAMLPEDVEKLVTLPMEQMLNGATGVVRVRSASGLGLSVVTVEFDWGTDVYRNRQIVQEKLQLIQNLLPEDVLPQMAPISSIMGQVQLIGIQSKSGNTSASEIRALVDFDLKYRLLGVPGVAKVVSSGGSARQLQVILDTERLRAMDITVEEVAEAIGHGNRNASGGFLDVGSTAPVITVSGLMQSAEDLEKVVISTRKTRPILVSDVAEVKFGPSAIKIGEAGVNGKSGVIMVVMKQPGFDTVRMTEAVDVVLSQAQQSLPSDLVIIPGLFRQADFIERAISNVIEAVRDGAIMVVVILFLFLMNFRTTFITLTAIPVSIAITCIVFGAFNISINTMTLGGLAVAIGALVDDAIVYLENIYRRMKENIQLPPEKQLAVHTVVFNASREVRRPVLIGTILVAVVYIPLFFLTGLEGKLFTPIGIAYIVSVVASFVVAITLTPAMCYILLPSLLNRQHAKDAWVVRKLKALTKLSISFSIRNARECLSVLLCFVLAGMVIIGTRGSQFLPEFNEGVAQINLILPPETGLRVSNEYGKRLEATVMAVEGVASVGRRTGRAEGDEHAEGVNTSEVIVNFDPESSRTREEMIGEIRERVEHDFPGVAFAVDQPLAHLLSHMLSGVKAQVAVKVFGPDLDELRRIAKDVESRLKPINGVKDLLVEPQILMRNIDIQPKREQLAQHGLNIHEIAELVELSLGGESVSRMIQGQYSFPIVLRLEASDRKHLKDIGGLMIRKPNGDRIPLSDVAHVRWSKTPNNINRENVSRRIVIQNNVAGRSLGEVVTDIKEALKPVQSSLADTPGYSLVVSGQFEAQEAATKRIIVLSILSLGLMLLFLYVHFGSVNLSLQVLMGIPMAFIGAVAYIILSEQTMSVATLVGLISLGGISARNSILLLDHYLHLMRHENQTFGLDLIIKAGQERMVPVMMTALTSGIALIPLVLVPGEPGKEILYPVATVIIGGLISSTLLDFIATPALFWLFGQKEAERLANFNKKSEDPFGIPTVKLST